MRGLAIALALSGCGRIGFDASGVDAASVPRGPLDFDGFESLTINGPLLDSPAPTSGDCGQFLTFFAWDDPLSMMSQEHMPFAFVDPDGTTLWFTYSCKYADTGWSATIGRWTPRVATEHLLHLSCIENLHDRLLASRLSFLQGFPDLAC